MGEVFKVNSVEVGQFEVVGNACRVATEDGWVIENPPRGFVLCAEEKDGSRWVHNHVFPDTPEGEAAAQRLWVKVNNVLEIDYGFWWETHAAYGSSAWEVDDAQEAYLDRTDPDRGDNYLAQVC